MQAAPSIPVAALEGLALFPLPDVVLFPNALLPLHVFEPRYRDMIADVLAGTRVLAVPRLRPGFEADYQGRPPIFDTAGLGLCIASDKLPDGRYDIMVRGLGRVLIEDELPPHRSYRLARARLLGDERSTRAPELAGLHQQLVALLDRLAQVVPDGGAMRQLARAVATPGGCADVVASALVRDPDARQTLLELLDPADRLDQVMAHVSVLISRFGAGEGPSLN